jgi:hypothetical protein
MRNERIPQSEMIARAVSFALMSHRQTRTHAAVGTDCTVSDFEAGVAQGAAPEPTEVPTEMSQAQLSIESGIARISDLLTRLSRKV